MAAQFETAKVALLASTKPPELKWLDERARASGRLYVHQLGQLGRLGTAPVDSRGVGFIFRRRSAARR